MSALDQYYAVVFIFLDFHDFQHFMKNPTFQTKIAQI